MFNNDQIAILQEQQSNLQKQSARLEITLQQTQIEFRAARQAGKAFDQILEKRRPYLEEYNRIQEELQVIKEKLCALEAEKQQAERQAEQERRQAERERQQAEQERLAREKSEKAKAKWADAESRLTGKAAKSIVDKLKVQITPSTECVELNDKFTKILFSRSAATTEKLLSGKTCVFVEKRRRKIKGKVKEEIVSKYTMVNAEGYTDTTPLNEFDRAVLSVIISEYLAGNAYTTVNIIFRALIGKVGDQNCRPRVNQRDAIIQSVMRLMAKMVDFSNFADSFGKMKYATKDGEGDFGIENLLSAGITPNAVINGQEMTGVIYFKDNSPLFDIADAKSQIIRYPHELLNVPNQNNTPRIIMLKKYVIRRICEIKLHKQLAHTITFDDVFAKCRIDDDSPRQVKADARNAVLKLFEHLKNQGFIKDFQLVQERGKFVSIKFSA